MKSLFALLFIVCMAVSFTGCKKCSDPTGVAMKTSDYIAVKWNCKRPDLVQRDVLSWMGKKSLCEVETGLISGIVCPIVASGIRKYAASKVPAEWECQEDLIGKDAASAFSLICGMIPY